MRKQGGLGVVLALIFILSGCAGSAAPTNTVDTSRPFVVGAVLPFTGSFGVLGQEDLIGFKVAAERINANGGILGRKVKIVTRDSQSNVNVAVLAARDLLDSEKPDLMIPETIAATVLGILPVTTPAKVLTMEASAGSELGNAQKYPYNFSYSYIKDQEVMAMVAGLKTMSVTKVAVLSTDDVIGHEFTADINKDFPPANFQVIGTEYFTYGTTDLTVVLQKLKNLKPDALAIHVLGSSVGTVMKAISNLNWNVPIMGDSSVALLDLSKLVPPDVSPNFFFPVPRISARNGDTVDSPFAREAATQGQTNALFVTALCADLLYYAQWAFNKAGSTDPDKVKAVLEGMGKVPDSGLPKDAVLLKGNLHFTSTDHGISKADLSSFWALAKVGPLVGGTQPMARLLTVPKPSGV